MRNLGKHKRSWLRRKRRHEQRIRRLKDRGEAVNYLERLARERWVEKQNVDRETVVLL